ncbi:MAG: hypothetical protein A2700_00170 [Candidatus Blackburnbacteria bacterium RIFCSPHIGHO2_01_FULL_44_64]|uniref:Uncharacterized protein n=1 Tax=Candidatus Blackburnbacteria bacterium RIFCSPHIGHO2_02_FULL_44_20 TaxID=1797516 RepID=A0A1G1V8M7_9BACT|nr:MAG: hypothetical protein A2700_00170 [Candidatus Blackburnbacteria bacterium RIFCSPHIGHO2_01_FULL_44_64]OGY11157.1 MAG: hypothetical protein A3E16_01315 [Candidatus Blackburnbacteria bacterium RIFCSPHIGHO2_12_FULL_44_25]OGY11552.1 MAG: hypothetical protein A3D26_03310 [Candidatus Blackburnbacteria bacterium RIFCSPHIGHO2_02_FULL_44_20]OGY14109.1 MAG: hypothetical protein A3A62_01975 [Candidatus Blackburnbacteria bacterium RIFCSPLOWO2_01_FULL_44_43]OGY15767.1 MAG: hypothetical protein A3H88_0
MEGEGGGFENSKSFEDPHGTGTIDQAPDVADVGENTSRPDDIADAGPPEGGDIADVGGSPDIADVGEPPSPR